MRGARLSSVLVTAGMLAAAIGGCGGGHAKSSSSAPARTDTSMATETNAKPPKPRTAPPRRLAPNPRRAAVERAVDLFVTSVERSDAATVCRLLGRPAGTAEGCARAAGIDLRAVPSSNELSVTRIAINGRRASARLSGGQAFSLRRSGRRWLISGLRT